jgi:hypothetical protein
VQAVARMERRGSVLLPPSPSPHPLAINKRSESSIRAGESSSHALKLRRVFEVAASVCLELNGAAKGALGGANRQSLARRDHLLLHAATATARFARSGGRTRLTVVTDNSSTFDTNTATL